MIKQDREADAPVTTENNVATALKAEREKWGWKIPPVTQKPPMALDIMMARAAMNAMNTTHREAAEAGVSDKLDVAVEALEKLDGAAREIAKLSDQASPQWEKLTIASLQARVALAKLRE